MVQFLLVGLAYRASDQPVVYPITRGSAPLATSLLAAAPLGESLSALAWLGVVLLSGRVGGAMVSLSYGTALWAMTKAPIGTVAALRETSVLFAAVIAALQLKERFGPVRWAGTAAIAAGLVATRSG